MPLKIEQGPIRPPSEAHSLLIRVTRNCTWGKCQFCHNYVGTKFSRRTVGEVKTEIKAIKKVCDEITKISLNYGYGGTVNREVVKFIYENAHLYSDLYRNTASWLYSGGQQVFLQDACGIKNGHFPASEFNDLRAQRYVLIIENCSQQVAHGASPFSREIKGTSCQKKR